MFITHFHDETQTHLYMQIVRWVEINSLIIDYVEMHDMKTQTNDKTKMKLITSMFISENDCSWAYDVSLHIEMIKFNMSHEKIIADIMIFIKIMLVFQKNIIFSHIEIKTWLNSSLLNLMNRNVIISYMTTFWESGKKLQLVMMNNFKAANENTFIIMKETKSRSRINKNMWQAQIITVSAKTIISLYEISNILWITFKQKKMFSSEICYTFWWSENHTTTIKSSFLSFFELKLLICFDLTLKSFFFKSHILRNSFLWSLLSLNKTSFMLTSINSCIETFLCFNSSWISWIVLHINRTSFHSCSLLQKFASWTMSW